MSNLKEIFLLISLKLLEIIYIYIYMIKRKIFEPLFNEANSRQNILIDKYSTKFSFPYNIFLLFYISESKMILQFAE